jgi:flavin-binding protein dodecin
VADPDRACVGACEDFSATVDARGPHLVESAEVGRARIALAELPAQDVPATYGRVARSSNDPLRCYIPRMAKKTDAVVYRVTEIIGTSTKSWEDAARNAVETAAKSLRDLRIAEVSKLDMKIEEGKVVAYRARVSLSFKYDA